MKVEGLPDLYFVLAVFVPGFIYNGTLRQFVPLHESAQKETVFLSLLTATAFNYALCSPLIYLLYRPDLVSEPERLAIWFLIILVVPMVLALVRAYALQHDRLTFVFRWLRLRPINPIPTGWDWMFSRTDPCFVLVTLKDGTAIAGWFGPNSMASSDPQRRDIYVEKVYKMPTDGSGWIEVKGSLGMQIDGAQISYIEFKEASDA